MKALKIRARLLGQFAKSVILVGFLAASHMAIASASPSANAPSTNEVVIMSTRPVARQSGFPACSESPAECKRIEKCRADCIPKFRGREYAICTDDCNKVSSSKATS